MIERIEKEPVATCRPAPGRIYTVLLAPLEQFAELDPFDAENLTPRVVVMEAEEKGLWLCCKLSLPADSCWPGPFDLYLNFEPFTHTLLECWNVVTIHESDFQNLGRSSDLIPDPDIIPVEWVERANELFWVCRKNGIVPDHLKSYVGNEPSEETRDDYWNFHYKEADIMELVRRKIHEGD